MRSDRLCPLENSNRPQLEKTVHRHKACRQDLQAGPSVHTSCIYLQSYGAECAQHNQHLCTCVRVPSKSCVYHQTCKHDVLCCVPIDPTCKRSNVVASAAVLSHPCKVIQLHPRVLADGSVVMLLQELTPVVNILPSPIISVEQLPHRKRSFQLQALLPFLQNTSRAGNPVSAVCTAHQSLAKSHQTICVMQYACLDMPQVQTCTSALGVAINHSWHTPPI
jgi:hypothetical protein